MSSNIYSVEAQQEDGEWVEIIGHETRGFCDGFVLAHRYQPAPRLAVRAIRKDGHVAEVSPAHEGVSLGMIAGFPSAAQYRRAGDRAHAMADDVERREALRKERRR